MNVRWFGLATGLILGGCALFARPEPAATRKHTSSNQPITQQNVSQLWRDNCQNCHGKVGEGGGAGTRTLLTKELFDQKHDKRFFDAIKDGVPDAGMEAFGATLTKEQIWAQVVHIRELQLQALGGDLGAPKDEGGVRNSQHHAFRIETAIAQTTAFQTPWAIDWLPDGRTLVTNRPGTIALFKGPTLETMIVGLPESREQGQGGLMDVAVHPDYKENGWIYLAYAEPESKESGATFTKIVRGKLAFGGKTVQWTAQQTIFEVPKSFYVGSGVHFGCRIVFDGKGHIYFTIGERGAQAKAQSLEAPNGKVYRVNEDGSIPKDNPFIAQGSSKLTNAIWSYGHRNPQGLAMDSKGVLWDTEHAPRGGDEVNRIQKGANYGWPLVSFGINYNNSPFATPWPTPDQKITQPVFRWLPSTGACGLDIGRGAKFPNWSDDLIAGGLAGNNVDRLRIRDDQVVEWERLVHGMGRVRDVQFGPDGFLYIVLNSPDMVIRLVPA